MVVGCKERTGGSEEDRDLGCTQAGCAQAPPAAPALSMYTPPTTVASCLKCSRRGPRRVGGDSSLLTLRPDSSDSELGPLIWCAHQTQGGARSDPPDLFRSYTEEFKRSSQCEGGACTLSRPPWRSLVIVALLRMRWRGGRQQ